MGDAYPQINNPFCRRRIILPENCLNDEQILDQAQFVIFTHKIVKLGGFINEQISTTPNKTHLEGHGKSITNDV